MARTISILCVHGIGHGDTDANLRPSWEAAIRAGVQRWDPEAELALDFLMYDDLFAHAPLDAAVYAEAMAKLLASAIVHSIGDLFTTRRALFDFPDRVRWTAGMVAQWATEDDLRQKACDAVLGELGGKSYDAVCAHSLGSLVCYDAFRRHPEAIQGKVFVSFGSQIGNPFVRDVFAGRIEPLEADTWYHLFNPDDHVFTSRINLSSSNFSEVATEFDIPNDPINHDAAHYLSHPNTVDSVWRDLSGARPSRALSASAKTFRRLAAKPTRRALLVGINEYPDPSNRLAGCANDAFLMSSLLQECGFEPDEIRMVLDERATAGGILERLHWLLDGVQPNDQRVFFYSGHGAQIPAYGADDEPDHMNECLVPYDFDWTPERAITDKQFKEFYSQLPYDSYFVAIFDCCHAGGMSRDGVRRVRGLSPPDDIRHRALRWNPELGMWEERAFRAPNPDLASSDKGEAYVGRTGASFRLGRAVALRTLPNAEYDRRRGELRHKGPYLPVVMEACREGQLSYEYSHGATAYGAFTYSLGQELRAGPAGRKSPTFTELLARTEARLAALRYDQVPCLVGPKSIIDQPVPWFGGRPRPAGGGRGGKAGRGGGERGGKPGPSGRNGSSAPKRRGRPSR